MTYRIPAHLRPTPIEPETGCPYCGGARPTCDGSCSDRPEPDYDPGTGESTTDQTAPCTSCGTYGPRGHICRFCKAGTMHDDRAGEILAAAIGRAHPNRPLTKDEAVKMFQAIDNAKGVAG